MLQAIEHDALLEIFWFVLLLEMSQQSCWQLEECKHHDISNGVIADHVTMATSRQLLFIWVAIYSQIRWCMQNILILIITYYQITTVIIKITVHEHCNLAKNVPTNKQ